MTTDLRDLLAIYMQAHRTGNSVPPHIDAEARAALADEPAAGEPVSVTGQPSNEEIPAGFIDPEHCGLDREMLATFYSACRGEGGTADEIHLRGLHAVLVRWGNPVPQSPAEGEVSKLVQHLHHAAEVDGWNGASPEWCQSMLRAAELLQRQEPVPVPVSERPWEGEGWCDKQGRCWFGREESDDWSADWTLATPEAVEEFCTYAPQTVCLPAHALPLPGQEVEG